MFWFFPHPHHENYPVKDHLSKLKIFSMRVLYLLSFPCSTHFQEKCASVKRNPAFHREERSAENYGQSLRQYFKLLKKGEEMLLNTWTRRALRIPLLQVSYFFVTPKQWDKQSQILNKHRKILWHFHAYCELRENSAFCTDPRIFSSLFLHNIFKILSLFLFSMGIIVF